MAATCWVAQAQGYFYASNAGSASVSGYQAAPNGQLTLLGQTGTDPGTIDASASWGGQFLYVQTGGTGIVDEFQINANGTLTSIGSVTVVGAVGGEGIVAFYSMSRERGRLRSIGVAAPVDPRATHALASDPTRRLKHGHLTQSPRCQGENAESALDGFAPIL